MECKRTAREVYYENLRGREGFQKLYSYDHSSSEYAPLIGWHFCPILVLVCDWPTRKRNLGRWLAGINDFFGARHALSLWFFHSHNLHSLYILSYYQHRNPNPNWFFIYKVPQWPIGYRGVNIVLNHSLASVGVRDPYTIHFTLVSNRLLGDLSRYQRNQ